MKRKWVKIVLITGITGLSAAAIFGGMIAYKAQDVSYDFLSYQVQYLDTQGITFRVSFALYNPTRFALDVFNQQYEVYVAGYRVSTVTSADSFRLIAHNTSVVSLDVRINWQDIEEKIAPITSQSQILDISKLQVVIRGHLGVRLGILTIRKLPIRASMPLGTFLP